MIPAAVKEVDLELVARAGDWLELLDLADATDEDRALAGACALAEAERRECEWAAVTLVLGHVSPLSGRVELDRWPEDPREQVRLAEALMKLCWDRPVPRGTADEAIGGLS